MMKIQAQRKNVTKEVCENVKKFLLKELPNYTVIDIVEMIIICLWLLEKSSRKKNRDVCCMDMLE